MLDLAQHRTGAAAAGHVVALVVDTQQIETRAVVLNYSVLGAQQAHAFFVEDALRVVFYSGVDFVVAVASPDTERSPQSAQFVNAGLKRIAFAADEVSGDDSHVRI